jgi:hypothetical protein
MAPPLRPGSSVLPMVCTTTHRPTGASTIHVASTEPPMPLRHLGRWAGPAPGGITVVDGGCPCMFGPTADFGHKVLRLVYAGHVPKRV